LNFYLRNYVWRQNESHHIEAYNECRKKKETKLKK